jgi:hypothetical protein
MKSTITTVFTIVFLLFSFFGISQTSLEGIVTNAETGEPIINATISVYKNDVLITGGETDLNGKYSILDLQPDNYNLEASFIGYITQQQIAVIIKKDSTYRFDFTLNQGHLLDEIIVKKENRPFASKKIRGIASSISGISSDSKVASMTSPRSGISFVGGDKLTELRTEQPLPSSGQITVGEWNDLHNWKEWISLLVNEEYNIMTKRYEIYPTQRYSVVIINKDKAVIPNIRVQLINNDNTIVWEALTDNAGKAELWGQPFLINEEENTYHIIANNKRINTPKTIDKGSNTIIINHDCVTPQKMDIVFTVDATSSMSDEIHYLKSELLDVIDKIQETNDEIEFRTGSVFYRDLRDKYLTRVSPLSSNKDDIIDFVMKQNASGGGDKPEAVDEAFEESLNLDWDVEALKLVFLILDAPPHEDEETLNNIRRQIKEAAKKGIKIIPITASGIGRETEFLMKFMAMMTNGTYVFITDDSGIGEAHLAPIVTDFEVEKLNDCIVRLINQYSKSYSCESDYGSKLDLEIKIYPNPSTQYINIETHSIAKKIDILASNGMLVKSVKPTNKSTKIELEDLVNGVYTANIYLEETVLSKQIILLK